MLVPIEPPATSWKLPDPADADTDAELLGVGAELDPATMLAAYRRGLFPMGVELPDGSDALGWWSPTPRGVLIPDEFHESRSLRRTRRQYTVTFNRAFADVVASCADPRRPHGWIDPQFRRAYQQLHDLGWAHSVEVWAADGSLAGGLFGIQIGGLFAAESKFHVRTDASKLAVAALCSALMSASSASAAGGRLIDVQWSTRHLQTLGVREIPRASYLTRLGNCLLTAPVDFSQN
ncbi:MAG: leucyl/phenylalanyl-tRNA--protein transferase [Actinobacteria bacterium]|nr:leucyl/phenylalanyl-tRNA--protein transferase [Actinomycetota bacterium]